MRTGDIAVVTPFRYSRLLFALGFAVLWFGERPDLMTLAGGGSDRGQRALYADAIGWQNPVWF